MPVERESTTNTCVLAEGSGMTDTDTEADEFERTLAETFEAEYSIDADVAADAAAKVAAFRADHDESLTTEGVLDALSGAAYDEFAHRFDRAIGHLADANDDCTDSREYRLAGFGDLAADPEQGV